MNGIWSLFFLNERKKRSRRTYVNEAQLVLHRFPHILSKYVSLSDLVCSNALPAKHQLRFTHCKTLSSLLNKLRMTISKHLHNMLKIAPASHFACCSVLVTSSKPPCQSRSTRTRLNAASPLGQCPCSGHQDERWLRGTDGRRKILPVTGSWPTLLSCH